MTPYIYLFIRKDLSIPQQIVQTAHAVEMVTKRLSQNHPTCHMVLFEVANEMDLDFISFDLQDQGVKHEIFYEPDISQRTAIATMPVFGSERNKFKQYKLKK